MRTKLRRVYRRIHRATELIWVSFWHQFGHPGPVGTNPGETIDDAGIERRAANESQFCGAVNVTEACRSSISPGNLAGLLERAAVDSSGRSCWQCRRLPTAFRRIGTWSSNPCGVVGSNDRPYETSEVRVRADSNTRRPMMCPNAEFEIEPISPTGACNSI